MYVSISFRKIPASAARETSPNELTQSGVAKIPLRGSEWSSLQQITLIAIYHFRDLRKKKMISP
jgi:hypothetical protein